MKDDFRKVATRLPAGIAVLLLVVACAGIAPPVRDELYPTDFSVDPGQELGSRMQQLGYELQQLDLALAAEHDEPPNLQQEVTGILREIERIADDVLDRDIPANHPFLLSDMSDFLADVRRARAAASESPPSYYMVGRLSGGCVNCHRSNR